MSTIWDRLPRPPWVKGEKTFGKSWDKAVKDRLTYLITQEKAAIDDYRVAAGEASALQDFASAKLFDEIRREEEHHLKELEARLRTLK